MKKSILILLALGLFSCKKDDPGNTFSGSPIERLPSAPDHIVFVWLENKGFSQIINSKSAPYINSLVEQGTLFTNFYALGHPSYPEYIKFFSGDDNGKKDDECIDGSPFDTPNLYTQLIAEGKTFAWYSEGLPQRKDACTAGKYVERHNPTQAFSNVPASVNKSWTEFPTDYSTLENVVCISPNLDNDMHDGTIKQGDDWVKENLQDLATWCKNHNSVFVVYYDEDNGTTDNHIPVIAVGEPVKANFKSDRHYDHYNMTRTILELYGAEQIGHSVTSSPIKDCWK
jgi:phosphatidylinositol-3-phosphatase